MRSFSLHFSLIGFSFICYSALFSLNSYIFSNLDFSAGVNWVFLPAGLRLLLTLVMVENAAIGITLASLVFGLNGYFVNDWITGVGAGLISGLAPYIAYRLVIHKYHLKTNLSNMEPRSLILCILVFSVISPVFHQVWFVSRNYTNDFFSSLGVMVLGDLLGSLIVIYGARLFISLYKMLKKK